MTKLIFEIGAVVSGLGVGLIGVLVAATVTREWRNMDWVYRLIGLLVMAHSFASAVAIVLVGLFH